MSEWQESGKATKNQYPGAGLFLVFGGGHAPGKRIVPPLNDVIAG